MGLRSATFKIFVLLIVLSLSLNNSGAVTYITKEGDSLSHDVAGVLIPGPVWGKKGSFLKILALNPKLKKHRRLYPGMVIQLGDLTTLPPAPISISEPAPATGPVTVTVPLPVLLPIPASIPPAIAAATPLSSSPPPPVSITVERKPAAEEPPIQFKVRLIAHPGYVSTSQTISGVQDSIQVAGYSLQDAEGGLRVILPEQVFMDLSLSHHAFSMSNQQVTVYHFNQSTTRYAEIHALGGSCTDNSGKDHQWCLAGGLGTNSMPVLTFTDNTNLRMTRAEDQFATLQMEYEKFRTSGSSWKFTGAYSYGLKRGQNEAIVWKQNQMLQTSYDLKIPRGKSLSFIIGTGLDYQWMDLKLNQDQFKTNELRFRINLGAEFGF